MITKQSIMGKLFLYLALLLTMPPIINQSLNKKKSNKSKTQNSTIYTGQYLNTISNSDYLDPADILLPQQTLFDHAVKAYDSEEWEAAEEYITDYIITSDNSKTILPESYYYYGRLLLNNGEYERAIKSFEKYFNEVDSTLLNPKAQFDYALCHLPINAEKAKLLFSVLAHDEAHHYAEESRRIIGVIH